MGTSKLHFVKKTTKRNSWGDVISHIAEVKHLGINESKLLTSKKMGDLESKIELQLKKWDLAYEKKCVEQDRIQFENEVVKKNEQAKKIFQDIETILTDGIKISLSELYWSNMVKTKYNPGKNPSKDADELFSELKEPIKIKKQAIRPKPQKIGVFIPKYDFLDKILKSRKAKKDAYAEKLYNEAIIEWEQEVDRINKLNQQQERKYNNQLEEFEKKKKELQIENDRKLKEWEDKKNKIQKKIEKEKEERSILRKALAKKNNIKLIEDYFNEILKFSIYPIDFKKSFSMEYRISNNMLVLEYYLPAPENFPKVEEYKYIKSTNDVKEKFISDTAFDKLYETTLYKIVLRTIYEIFKADDFDFIEAICFNGWVSTINKSTGKTVTNCIISIHVSKKVFNEIDLSKVEPKQCFKTLKGVSANKLIDITAIQPVLQINKSDKRFVSSYNVADSVDQSCNLATMSWEDFEHLIREIFEKEFIHNRGEVKVTQASRDGGVDAIAFDPDPIRGGKIVIQAKRYTNTVGVSAVRDLYGTLMNEGATKGILVTTADYGNDAYEFAKNKPITLLNGSHLLYLLKKHGHSGRINLAEAKKINREAGIK